MHGMARDVHAEDRLRLLLRLRGIGRELDAAGLPAAADQHLGLHDDRAAELLSCGPGLGRRGGDGALRDRDPVAREELLALVLVEVHRRGSVEKSAVRRVRRAVSAVLGAMAALQTTNYLRTILEHFASKIAFGRCDRTCPHFAATCLLRRPVPRVVGL